ncbi:hypothetical protein PybrP1_006310 [[Pythium] brassicae (nom. inval.)]|nr:hypothetical protein PybrP1_006310 [[Pythium] brassicae (nom. inval.)]
MDAEDPSRIVPLAALFRFADAGDYALMMLGTIGALAAGLGQPIQIVLIGNVMNAFNPTNLPDGATLRANVNSVALNFVWVGLGMIAGGFIQVACWSLTASRQAKRLRSAYVSAILTKHISWFDLNDSKQLATRVADSTVTIQEGMGRKVGDGLHFLSMGFAGITIGFVKGWELTLVLLAFTPLIAATAFVSMKFMAAATQTGIESYGAAGAIAQEALGNVRTVHMFNAIQHFVDKYAVALEKTTTAGIRKGFAVGWGMGVMFFTIYCTYAAGLYFGAVQISNDQLSGTPCTDHGCYDGGKVITIFFAIIMGAMALGQAGPSVQAIYAARTCAYDVFRVINEGSEIDPLDESGRKLDFVSGAISLQPEWKFFVLGSLGAVVNAAVFPLWGVILTKIIVLFFDVEKSPSEMRADARYWSLGFIVLGVFFGASIVLQHYGFAVASQNLVSRVRNKMFAAMLQQEIGWFDLEDNTSGALVSRLATDSATLQAITSETLNQGLVNITTLGIGLAICFFYSWQMSLAALAMLPVIMLFALVQSEAQTGKLNNRKSNSADIEAGSLLSESISSIRTVASFSMEQTINVAYASFLDESKSADVKTGVVGGITFGVSQGAMYISVAFLFWLGGKWVSEGTISFEDMFMVMMVLVLSTFAVGMAAQNLSDTSKAKQAAQSVFRIIDRVPAINSTAATGDAPSALRGEIEFQNGVYKALVARQIQQQQLPE